MAAGFPKFKGRYVSWASLSIRAAFDTGEFTTRAFASLDWSDKLEPGKVRGNGAFPRGRTTGEYDSEGKMSMNFTAGVEFMKTLAKENQSIGLVEFDIQGAWDEGDGAIHQVVLESCRIQERNQSNAQGTDATVIEFTLSVMAVKVDGVYLLVPEVE